MATLNLSFSEKLECGKCDDVLLQLQDPTLIVANAGQTDPAKIFHFIPGSITNLVCVGGDTFQYTVQYDEDLVTRLLTECDIRKACCAGCFLQYLNETVANLAPCIADSDTIDFQIDEEGCITGEVFISETAQNALVALGDGLYVPETAALGLGVNDTASVDLTLLAGPVLEADVKISGLGGNILIVNPDGLFVSPTVLDTTSIDFSVSGAGVISGSVKVSADAFNLLESHADGLYVPASNGWLPFNVAATFVSATSFSVPGDFTDRIGPGDKIKITDGTVKFFAVLDATFALGVTTFSLTAGIDFSLSGGALTFPFFSHDENPNAWPSFFNHTPVFIGFSADPVGGRYIFRVVGKFIEYDHRDPGNGISDDTIYRATLPVPLVGATANAWVKGTGTDNSVYNSDVLAEVGGGIPLTDVAFTPDGGGAVWTAANIKQVRISNLKYQYAA